MNRGVFITGTDTGVGKTLTSALLLSAIPNGTYFKPIQTGDDDDTQTVLKLTAKKIVDPVYRYPQPISPHRAARLNQDQISLEVIHRRFQDLTSFTVVEGAGGLLVPVNDQQTMADLIKALELPVLLVASTKLGTINHTLLTLECGRARGLQFLGIVLSGPEDMGLKETLEFYGKIRVLAEVPSLNVNQDEMRNQGQKFFSPHLSLILEGEDKFSKSMTEV